MNELVKLAKNAKLGDGCFWKHPESRLYNLVFTGVNRDWIQYKANMLEKPVTVSREKKIPLLVAYFLTLKLCIR